MRARVFRWAFGLLGGILLAAGCSNSGSYTLKWQFVDDGFKSGDCGRVGVSGIGIAATRPSDGSQSSIAVPCALGFYDGSLDAGSWTLALVALDASGQPKVPLANEPQNQTPYLRGQTDINSPVEIHAGEQAAPIPAVLLPPLPQCQDGVDNDLDGRVDLDDSDCVNPDGTPNPDGMAECIGPDGMPCPGTSVTDPNR